MLRSYYDPWAKTFCGADAVFQRDGAKPTQLAPLVAWPALSPDMSKRQRFVGFMGGSRRPREPNGPHDAGTSRVTLAFASALTEATALL